jgi:exonuclease III
MNGFSYFKAFLVLIKHDLDVLCVQEMWMPKSKASPEIPGYKLLEQRRAKGKRGGIAMYINSRLDIINTKGNEYA